MSQALFLLDTNILLALARGGDVARYLDSTFGLRSLRVRPLICVVSHGELRVIARRRARGPEKLQALDAVLTAFTTVDIHHPEVVEAYVEIDVASQAHSTGARNMGKNDLWIAAAARAAGATLLTTDRDFDHLNPDLLTVAWVDPALAAVKTREPLT